MFNANSILKYNKTFENVLIVFL